MENASKAVIMAASVMVAVAVISLALYTYSYFRNYAEVSEEKFSLSQTESFNKFYQAYEDTTGKVRGVDVVNIYNRAIDDEVEVYDGYSLLKENGHNGYYVIKDERNYLNMYNYNIEYDSLGRVRRVTFSN